MHSSILRTFVVLSAFAFGATTDIGRARAQGFDFGGEAEAEPEEKPAAKSAEPDREATGTAKSPKPAADDGSKVKDESTEGESVAPPEAEQARVASSESSRAPLAAIVRGLYVQVNVGGGYAVTSAAIDTGPLEGVSEALGAGSMIGFSLGYDATSGLAIQAVGGAAMVSGRRTDRVRDVSLLYGGAGAKLAFPLEDRLHLNVAVAGVFVQASDGVAEPEGGAGILAGVGLEYFVHVRHFSLGIEAQVLAPFSPSRTFVALTPQLKYTF